MNNKEITAHDIYELFGKMDSDDADILLKTVSGTILELKDVYFETRLDGQKLIFVINDK